MATPSPRTELAELRALVGALDPAVLAAADDVDRSLIALALARRPLERAEFAAQMLATLSGFRRAGGSGGRV